MPKKEKNNDLKALIKGNDRGKHTASDKLKKALKVRFALEQEPKVDMYFYRIYRKVRLVRYLCVLFAALFVMSVPMVYSDQITTENFKYLLKYIDMQLSEETEFYTELSYEASDNMQFGVYAEDIVICTNTALVYYDKLGNETFRTSFGPYHNARLLISDKYVMVYDQGGNEYAIYNNFKMVHHGTTEYPITLCALADSGRYAVLSANQNYLSELVVYTANFEQMNRVQKDMYISSLFFVDNSDEFGYTGFTTDAKGGKKGEVCYYNSKSEKTVGIVMEDIPLDSVSDGNRVGVICSDKMVWYNRTGEMISQYRYEGKATGYCHGQNTTAICFPKLQGSDFGYLHLIQNENEKISVPLSDEVLRIRYENNSFYTIGKKTVQRIDKGGVVTSYSIKENALDLIFLPNEQMMICYPDKTEFISFADINAES